MLTVLSVVYNYQIHYFFDDDILTFIMHGLTARFHLGKKCADKVINIAAKMRIINAGKLGDKMKWRTIVRHTLVWLWRTDSSRYFLRVLSPH